MADPLTTNKFLAQPVPGTDVGTWGTPLNNNFGILDNSFGGVATIPLTNAPVVLSAAQYQCAFIVFTGTLTGNCAITFPSIGSFYSVQNLTSNSSTFQVTLQTTAAGGQLIGCPPGEAVDVFTDGANVKFRNLGRVGTYWDYGGSSVPWWVSACTVPPYLNCDGTVFSSATFPVLAMVLGGTTLPDSKGRMRINLDQGAGRISSAYASQGGLNGSVVGAAGGGQTVTLSSFNMPSLPITVTDPGHDHTFGYNTFGGYSISGTEAGIVYLSTNPAGSAATLHVTSAATNITVSGGSSNPTATNNLPPAYIGGLTLIRSA